MSCCFKCYNICQYLFQRDSGSLQACCVAHPLSVFWTLRCVTLAKTHDHPTVDESRQVARPLLNSNGHGSMTLIISRKKNIMQIVFAEHPFPSYFDVGVRGFGRSPNRTFRVFCVNYFRQWEVHIWYDICVKFKYFTAGFAWFVIRGYCLLPNITIWYHLWVHCYPVFESWACFFFPNKQMQILNTIPRNFGSLHVCLWFLRD